VCAGRLPVSLGITDADADADTVGLPDADSDPIHGGLLDHSEVLSDREPHGMAERPAGRTGNRRRVAGR
jgi:hypothetical protein